MIPMFDRSKNTLFLDMDGVLADFDKFVLKLVGRTFDHVSGPGADTEMWDRLKTVDHLYLQLEPTPYCHQLFDLANLLCPRVKILTAIPRRTTMASAEADKREWVKKYLGTDVEVLIGPYSRDKWKHASRGDILIDDRADNIRDWINKGQGIGLLHDYENYPKTAERLEHLVLESEKR